MKHNEPLGWFWLRDQRGKWHGAYDKQIGLDRHGPVLVPHALHGGGRNVCKRAMSRRPRDAEFERKHVCKACLPEIANQVLLHSVLPPHVVRVDPALSPLVEGVTPTGRALRQVQWVDVKELNKAGGSLCIYSGSPPGVDTAASWKNMI